MQPLTPATLNVDLTRIENAEIRRTIRQLVQQLQDIITHQQVQIEALVEMTVDKHVWSLSEYRRYVQKLSQSTAIRPEHLPPSTPHPVRDPLLQAHPQEVDASLEENEGRHVYRL